MATDHNISRGGDRGGLWDAMHYMIANLPSAIVVSFIVVSLMVAASVIVDRIY